MLQLCYCFIELHAAQRWAARSSARELFDHNVISYFTRIDMDVNTVHHHFSKGSLLMSVVLLFYRITRDVNPGIANFRNLEEQQFLLGAIGDLSGKHISDTFISKFKVANYEVKQWNTF